MELDKHSTSKVFSSNKYEEAKNYWMYKLQGDFEVSGLPNNHQKISTDEHNYNTLRHKFPETISKKLYLMSGKSEYALYLIMLSGVKYLLHKYTNCSDVIVGMPSFIKDKDSLGESNYCMLRTQINGNDTFKGLLNEIKNNVGNGRKYMYYSFNVIAEQLGLISTGNVTSLLKTIVMLSNIHDASCLELLKPETIFNFTSESEGIELNIKYDSKMFKQEEIEALFSHIENYYSIVVNNPDIKLSDIEMLTIEEKNKILYDFNNTNALYQKNKTVFELFEEQVEKSPDNIAIVFEDRNLTYRDLNGKANSIARLLREKGIKPDNIVGIMVDRSIEMIIGIMGILKAGGAYLPIDPEYPEDRIRYMLEDSNAKIFFIQNSIIDKVKFDGVVIDLGEKELYEGNKSNLEKVNNSNDLAYVIYTSGSTGKPKGVMVEHYSLINRLNWMQNKYPIGEDDTILQKTPITFDVSVWELFWWSMNGAKLCILSPGQHKNPNAIVKAIDNNNITVIHFVPSMLNMFLEYIKRENILLKVSSLRKVFASGETLSVQQVKEFNNLFSNFNIQLYNLYGPTEATIDVTFYNCLNHDCAKTVPIGKPIDNTRLYIFDENNRIQPIGIAGELCIAGDGLARGYLNKPELTAEKFIPNPYEPGNKIYRTGDIARWIPDGNIEYIGRIDHQVKIRGFRIELGEIESKLLRHESVMEAVVIDREDNQGDKYLCAYIVCDKEITITDLRGHLLKDLPEYMVPAYFKYMIKLPLTPNGKIDRKALPEPEGKMNTGVEYISPRNEIEEKLARAYKKVLEIEKVGIDDDFFAIGGNSLKVIMLEVNLQNECLNIDASKIYQYRTIRKIAECINVIENCTTEGENDDSNIKESSQEINVFQKETEICSTSNERVLKNIEPFNELFFKSCFFNSLFPVVHHFNKNDLSILINDIILYSYDKSAEVPNLDIDYLSIKSVEQTIDEAGICYSTKIDSEDLIEDIIYALDNDRCVIVWVDCFYLTIRNDTYLKEHRPHTLLIYGYNKIEEKFYVIEQLNAESLTYEKRMIKFADMSESYQGYLRKYNNVSSMPSYIEFFVDDEDQAEKSVSENNNSLYLGNYLANIKAQRNACASQLDNLKRFIERFNVLSADQSELLQNSNTLIEGLNNIINAKQVEKYKILKLFNDDFQGVTLINDIIDNWGDIRSVILKYSITSVYKQKSFELVNRKLEDIYRFEQEYYNKILSLIV